MPGSNLNETEMGAVVGGLRLLQATLKRGQGAPAYLMDFFAACSLPTEAQIDRLCEGLTLGNITITDHDRNHI